MRMKVNRDIVSKSLTSKFLSIDDPNQLKADSSLLRKQFGIPDAVSASFITARKNLIEASDFLLYAFTCIYYPKKIDEWFTSQEIKHYSKDKYIIEKVKFPLRFKMIQVEDDQYIGTTSAKELMKLREAQLINYNENAQRTMKHIIHRGKERYQIMLNKRAVANILESYENGLYIPDVITLNIPDGSDFFYDEELNELVIKKIDAFDITDGYHRYVAMGKAFDHDSEFNQKMELRITNFSIDKANRFIWQEDQKTKMSKVNSDSMDTTRLANKIVNRLNMSTSFVLNGKISRNHGLVDAAILADVIDQIYTKNITKTNELKMMLNIQNELMNNIEELCIIDPDVLNNRWNKFFILSVVYNSKNGTMKAVDKTYQKLMRADHIYTTSHLTTGDMTKLEKLLK